VKKYVQIFLNNSPPPFFLSFEWLACQNLRVCSEMISLKFRVDIYENLLSELKAHVDSAGQLAISKALQGVRILPSPLSACQNPLPLACF
jgi:hypothetical protein